MNFSVVLSALIIVCVSLPAYAETWSNFINSLPTVNQGPGDKLPIVRGGVPYTINSDDLVTLTSSENYGFVGDGTTDNASAFSSLFADARSPKVYFPPGVYRLSCDHTYVAASALSLMGAGKGITTIQLDPNCALNNDPGSGLFHWPNKPYAGVYDLTIDLNGATAAAHQNVVHFQGGTFNFLNSEIKGGTATNMLLLVASTPLGMSISDYRIQHNSFSTLTSSPVDNQCIALTTLGNIGAITRGMVTDNICVNTAMQIDGTHNVVANNDISGWQFGAGIYAPQVEQNSYSLFANNNFHDSGLEHDANGFAASGIESDGDWNVIVGNTCLNLGGPCVTNFSKYASIMSNSAINTGQVHSPYAPYCEQAGFNTSADGGHQYGAYSTWIGNSAINTLGNSSMKYGYCENGASGYAPGIKFIGNNFNGATSAYYFNRSTNPPLIDWVLLAQQPEVSNVSTIDFVGLDTASYHSWKLECRGIGPVTNAQMFLRTGQGPTPTWQTSGNYQYTGIASSVAGSDLAQFNSTTGDGIRFGPNQWVESAMNTLVVEVGDLGLTDAKAFRFSATGLFPGTGLQDVRGAGAWSADNNPITSIRLMAAGVNISAGGGCKLWGLP